MLWIPPILKLNTIIINLPLDSTNTNPKQAKSSQNIPSLRDWGNEFTSRHNETASFIRSINSSKDLAWVWQPLSWGTVPIITVLVFFENNSKLSLHTLPPGINFLVITSLFQWQSFFNNPCLFSYGWYNQSLSDTCQSRDCFASLAKTVGTYCIHPHPNPLPSRERNK